jgi:hypothetical protein
VQKFLQVFRVDDLRAITIELHAHRALNHANGDIAQVVFRDFTQDFQGRKYCVNIFLA